MSDILFKLISISKNFTKANGRATKILDNVSLNIKEGEIVAILGKSGSGKSTLLKIIAGLISPTGGTVKFNRPKLDKDFGISMVFQNFALFPWLTVLENVELGLDAMDIPKKTKRERVLQSIALIGLTGFESAYPRELSGGMRQRVGFARALVVNPDILLMDEPFSALDILTSDTLKNDFLNLWTSKKTQLKSVIIVTHSIEEAVVMADRVLIFGSNPGHIISELQVTIDRPRDIQSSQFHSIIDKIYSEMAAVSQKTRIELTEKPVELLIGQKLPLTSANRLAALTAAIASYDGSSSLANLVKILHIKTPDILHVTEALTILKFATITKGNIILNEAGIIFAKGGLEERKKIFATHLLANVPLADYIIKILQERSDNKAPKARFLTYLEDHLPHHEAIINLKTIIDWGRYAEIFSYDDNKQMFSLEKPT